MNDLEKAFISFIEAENMIDKVDEKQKQIQDKFDEETNRHVESYNFDDASSIYNLHLEIKKHIKEVEAQKEKLRQAEDMIKELLELLNNKRVIFTNPEKGHKTYSFYLDKGKVKHNHSKY